MTKNKTLLSVVLAAALVSCSDHAGDAAYTVGSEDNAIALTLGMNNSPTASTTRSGLATRAESTPSYVALQANTGILMRVEGTWTKHDPESIIKTTNASAESAAEGTKYNTVSSYSPTLYWDDYGTADPANASTGLTQGLAIYAVAVDGTTTAPTVKYDTANSSDEWGSTDESSSSSTLSWSTIEDASNVNDQILHKDLLVSNNLSGTGDPGRLTFAEHKAIRKNTEDKDEKQSRLVFNHVLSKITFKLKAADGFSNYQFTNPPIVELTRGKSDDTETNYCYTEGSVNIKKGVATATTSSTSKVTLKQTGTATVENYEVVTEEAVVYPGTVLGSNKTDIVARVNADGNIYYVTAEQIMTAIDNYYSSSTTDADKYHTKAGYNYIFNITVKKTAINVTATVTDWTGITAETVTPVINVSAAVGNTSTDTNSLTGFSFYRMADEETGDNRKYSSSFKSDDNSYYKEEAYGKLSGDGTTKTCQFYSTSTSETPMSLYWPDHQTHYHFRGISPETGSSSSDTGKPLVVDYTKSDNTTTSQGILVKNCAYSSSTFPSNLMIGMPEISENNKMCGNKEHTNGNGEVDMSEHGICARTGNINLNFRYMMSQVIVNLSTTVEDASKIHIDGNTKVEIVGAETEGYVDLHTREIGSFKSGSTKGYTLTKSSSDTQRHDCIVPQSLNNLQFKISVYAEDDNNKLRDIYYATISDIEVSEGEDSEKKKISAWESGKKYTYNLKLSKSEVKVTATLTDWETKNADTDIWL